MILKNHQSPACRIRNLDSKSDGTLGREDYLEDFIPKHAPWQSYRNGEDYFCEPPPIC